MLAALLASTLPLIFQQGPGRGIASAVWIVWVAMEVSTRRPAASGDAVQDHGTRWFFVVGLLPSMAGAWLVARELPSLGLPGDQWVTFGIGCAVSLGGVALRRWAIAALGRFFTREVMIRPGHTLISNGPYRLLRHPSYTGLMLAMLGYGVMLQNWLSLALVVAGFCIAILPRIRQEEHVLEANLGVPYREFERTHKRLIPLVW